MGRNPTLGPPRDCWSEIPEALQAEMQEHVRESPALGYPIVQGWRNAAVVLGMSVTAIKRAIAKGRIPKFRTDGAGPRGCQVCWPLSMLWDFRQWREMPRRDGGGGIS